MRPNEFDRSRAPSLWGDKGIQPHGIVQGGLGDCYMLASLSALAMDPRRIEKLFTNTMYPSSGLFMVTFWRLGDPVKVVIDDRLPLLPNPTGRYVDQFFNSKMSPNGAWWAVLIEKAYCKMNVNCARINGGTPLMSLSDLTGMPVLKEDVAKLTDIEMYKSIHEGSAYSPPWPMVASCVKDSYGLQAAHAYSLLQTLKL